MYNTIDDRENPPIPQLKPPKIHCHSTCSPLHQISNQILIYYGSTATGQHGKKLRFVWDNTFIIHL